MLLRRLIVLGLCAVFGVTSPAFAAPAKPQKAAALTQKTKKPADAKSAAKGKKKIAGKGSKAGKKIAAKQTEEVTEKDKAKAKAEAAEKARQAKLLAMRAKAKADAEARRAAYLAPKEKAAKERGAKEEAPAKRKSKLVDFANADIEAPKLANRPVTGLTAERIAAQEAAAVGADVVLQRGNNGELRSSTVGTSRPRSGFFQILFGDEPEAETTTVGMLPETRALDSVLDKKKKFKVKPEYEPQSVAFSGYPSGTIVIDTSNHFLYLVEGFGSARRYGIAVGREGLQYKGMVTVGDKQEWPRWIPTLDMQKREPKKYGQYKDGMPGGGQNPLGARAIYLYQGKQDTHLRIHGTIAPQTIGTNSSNGCFRMVNEHVMDLYRRVGVGTKVVIL